MIMKNLEFQNEIFCNLVQEDCLVVLAKGLGVEDLLINLIKLYCDPMNLVLIIGTFDKEEDYIMSKLKEEGAEHLPKVITSEFGTNIRHSMYMEGGVLFVTSRILVMDMLTERIPIDLITGIIVYRAHKIIESCQEAFILRLYKEKNKTGFVKALSDSPVSFTTGFCQVNRVMKNLFVGNLQLWPRFHSNVKANLEKFKPEVIELQLKMTGAMQAIQMAVLDVIASCVKEIRRLNPSVDTEELSVENAMSKALDKIVKLQLEPVWHQLGPKTKNLVYSLKTLRTILISLTQCDCVSFYSQLNLISASEKSFQNNADWLMLDPTDTIFKHAKERVFGKENPSKKAKLDKGESKNEIEVNPKWLALSEILNEVNESVEGKSQQTHVLVLVDGDRTCRQLKEYLTEGSQCVLKKQLKLSEESFEATKSSTSPMKRSKKQTEKETDKEQKSDECSLSDDLYYGVINEPLTSFLPIKNFNNPYAMLNFLNEFHPTFVVLYNADMATVRQLEIYKAKNPELPLRVYCFVYEESAEEQRYLTTLKKEKQAFEYLIREKVTMVIPSDIEGRAENHPDLLRDATPANETVSSRKGGFHKISTVPQKVIVDMREFKSELPSLIHRRGIDIVPLTIEVGDYILSPDICIERKSISDLISSLHSGRLYNQAQAMIRYYKRPILLIEFDQNKAFSLKGKFYLSNEGSSDDVTSRLILLTLHFPKLRVMWSPNPYATAELFEELKTGKTQPDPEQALKISSDSSSDIIPYNYNHTSENLLLKLPGVTQKNVKSLMWKGVNLPKLSSMSKNEINDILQNSSESEMLYNAFNSVSISSENSSKKPNTSRNKFKPKFSKK